MSAYIHLMTYIQKKFQSPDPGNLDLMNLNVAPTSDAFMISICTFLANYSQLPQEISKRDE